MHKVDNTDCSYTECAPVLHAAICRICHQTGPDCTRLVSISFSTDHTIAFGLCSAAFGSVYKIEASFTLPSDRVRESLASPWTAMSTLLGVHG